MTDSAGRLDSIIISWVISIKKRKGNTISCHRRASPIFFTYSTNLFLSQNQVADSDKLIELIMFTGLIGWLS
jgi:hypothetical protein